MAREIVDPGASPVIAVPDEGLDLSSITAGFGQLAIEFSRRAKELRVIDAKRQGALAGISGPVELRDSVKAKDQAFNDAANQTSMNRLEISMRADLQRLEDEHPADTQEFLRLSSENIKSLVEEMKTQNPLMASALELRGRGYQATAAHRIRKTALENLQDAAHASRVQVEDSVLIDIENEFEGWMSGDPERVAVSIDAVGGHILRLLTLWHMPDPDGTGTLLSQKDIARRTGDLMVSVYSSAVGAFIRNHKNPSDVETALQDGTFQIPTLVIDEVGGVLGGENIDLNPKTDLPDKVFNDLITLARQEQGRRDGDLRNEFDKRSTQARLNFNARLTGLEEVGESRVEFTAVDALALARGDELEANQFMERMASAEKVAEVTPQVSGEHIFDTRQRIAEIDLTGPDAVTNKIVRDAFIVANQRKEDAMMSGRGFDYVMATPQGQEAGQAFNDGNLSESEYREFIKNKELSIARGVFGFVPSIMQTNESLEFVNQFNQLENTQQALDFISSLQVKFGRGKNLELALNDLVKQGLPSFSAVLIGMDSRTHEARVLMRAWQFGRKALEDDFSKKADSDKVDDGLANRMREIAAALPGGNDQLLVGMSEAAKFLARGLVIFEGESEADAVEKAYEAIVLSRWVIASGVAMPVGKDTEQVLAAVTPRGFARFVNLNRDEIDPALITTDALSAHDYIETLLEEGQFVPDAEDEGLELIDSQGRPVLKRDGTKLKAGYDTSLFDIGEELIVQSGVVIGAAEGQISVTAEDVRRRRVRDRRLEFERTIKRHPIQEAAAQFIIAEGFDISDMTNEEIVLKSTEIKRRRANRKK